MSQEQENEPELPNLPRLIPYDPEHPDGEEEAETIEVPPTPEMEAAIQTAIETLFEEPFPRKPFALIPQSGERTPEFSDYLIHKDIDTERQCVFVFDSVVDAFAVAEEYLQATGKQAEPVECDIYSLPEDQFWVKFYRANGMIAVLPIPEYKKHILLSRDY